MDNRPIVALIGRPNVGKSTLFNRLLGRREAITSFKAGTTRDRHFGVMHWYGHSWSLVDTAGLLLEDDETELSTKALQNAIDEQIMLAIDEADLLAFVVDIQDGLHPHDRRIMEQLRKQPKPVVVLANKADNQSLHLAAESFHQLGVKELFPVSAIHGRGLSDVVEYMVDHIPSPDAALNSVKTVPTISFIGRPNVGKSTLINRILGQKRLVVSEVPGTTRDSIKVDIQTESGKHFHMIDTAGIRRRGRVEDGIEKFSLFRTLRTINESDIVVLLLTIEEVPTRGDAHVAMYALEAKKKLIVALNKADLARDDIFKMNDHKQHNLGQRYLKRFAFLQRLPYVFVSGQTGQGLDNLWQTIERRNNTI
jgi:GTPase